MQKRISKFYDSIAMSITGLGTLINMMFLLITAMTPFSHTLFQRVYPAEMSWWAKAISTWIMAVVWESTVLITTVNRHISKKTPKTMAFASGIMFLFATHAFDPTLTAYERTELIFVSVLITILNYIFADLFVAKWEGRLESLKAESTDNAVQSLLAASKQALIETQNQLSQSRLQNDELCEEMNQVKAMLTEANLKLAQQDLELQASIAFRKEVELERTCPLCNVVQASGTALSVHKGYCGKKRKGGKVLAKTVQKAGDS